MAMTPRERVLTTLQHEEPDRVPIVIGASNATGIKMKPYREVKKLEGIEASDDYMYDWPELGTAHIDEETMLRLHSDVRGVTDLEPLAVRERNRARDPHSNCFDSWGGGQMEVTPGDWFPGIHPIPDATCSDDLDRYEGWPDMSDPSRITHVKEQAQSLADDGQFAIMATPWLLFPFERAHAMQGMEAFLMNMALRPDFARELLERIAEECKALMGRFLGELGDNVDIIKIGDDLGTQENLMISPKMYREILKPVHADFIQFIKDHTKAKVLFHSCGDVALLIEDFIEIGVDILNPIQASSGKLSDFAALKERHGSDIVLCGGIDTHRILPFGTPDDVRREVRRVIDLLGPGGGFMIGAVHTIMNDVPAENLLAMVDAVEEYGSYPLLR